MHSELRNLYTRLSQTSGFALEIWSKSLVQKRQSSQRSSDKCQYSYCAVHMCSMYAFNLFGNIEC